MKLQIGILLLLVAASILLQDIIGFSLLQTFLIFLVLYLLISVNLWMYKRYLYLNSLQPQKYMKMNRLSAGYSRKGTLKETEANLAVVQGLIDMGEFKKAEDLLDDISSSDALHKQKIEHRIALLRATLAVVRKDGRAAKAHLRDAQKGRLLPQEKLEYNFTQSIYHLLKKEWEKVSVSKNPNSKREALMQSFLQGWLHHGKNERALVEPNLKYVVEEGQNFWYAKEAEAIIEDTRAGKEYTPWKSVLR